MVTAAAESDSESENSPEDKSLTVDVGLLVLQDEVTDVVDYARNYLSIEREEYPQGMVQATY